MVFLFWSEVWASPVSIVVMMVWLVPVGKSTSGNLLFSYSLVETLVTDEQLLMMLDSLELLLLAPALPPEVAEAVEVVEVVDEVLPEPSSMVKPTILDALWAPSLATILITQSPTLALAVAWILLPWSSTPSGRPEISQFTSPYAPLHCNQRSEDSETVNLVPPLILRVLPPHRAVANSRQARRIVFIMIFYKGSQHENAFMLKKWSAADVRNSKSTGQRQSHNPPPVRPYFQFLPSSGTNVTKLLRKMKKQLKGKNQHFLSTALPQFQFWDNILNNMLQLYVDFNSIICIQQSACKARNLLMLAIYSRNCRCNYSPLSVDPSEPAREEIQVDSGDGKYGEPFIVIVILNSQFSDSFLMAETGKQSGVTLTWSNVYARVGDKQILTDCSGYCEPGSMLAIMGPSGAGKTTLLSILAKKKSEGLSVEGNIEANNCPFNERTFYNFGSFVFQNDILYETLTVKETLNFVARLKIKSEEEAGERTEELLKQFELRKCADTYVGGKIKKGVSGGEKKRVCIAVEMVTKPSVLILDEPTSGLDSHTANAIIGVLSKLAEERKTIVFTIHQPSYKIYSSLDRLILLNKGSTIYQGAASGIGEYMMGLGISIPTKTTICDFFMMEISEYKHSREGYDTPFNYGSYAKKLEPGITKQIQDVKRSVEEVGFLEKKTALSRLDQFKILFSREALIFFRSPMKFGRAIANAILMVVLIGLIFYQSIGEDYPDPATLYPTKYALIGYFIKAQGVCFVNVTSVIMTGIFSVSLVFPTEREVYAKETASKTYNTLPYFLAKLILEAFSLCVGILLFASGNYWLVGFDKSAEKFFLFVVCLCVMAFVGNSIGFLTGALFKDTQRASSMAPALLLPLMMFSGLYNKLDSIPAWIAWLQYISPFRYGLHSILLNEFGDSEYQTLEGTFSYKEDLAINLSLEQNLLITLALAVFYYTLAYIFLKKLASKLAA